MAQTGYTPILIYSSSTTTNAPAVGNLTNSALGSELAINITDGKLFYKDNANAIQVIGWKVVPATAGGTGLTSYTQGDLIYATSSTTLGRLADVATGNALISGGVGADPAWGKVGLTTHVSGTLPTANGGTNLTSFTANGVMYASSTSALATGSALTFDGATLGVGVAGSAWSTLKAIDLGAGGAVYGTTAQGGVTANAYYGASGFVYKATNTAGVYQIVGNSHRWSNAVSGTAGTAITFREDLRLTSAGDLEVKTGNITQGTAAKGINFTANTPLAGKTSQLLNWYEEGTWTPTDVSGAGLSLSGSGDYVRIGSMVKAAFSITYPITANASQNYVSLPFNSNGGGGFFVTYTTFGSAISGYVDGTNNRFVIVNFSGTPLTNATLSTKRIDGVLMYRAA